MKRIFIFTVFAFCFSALFSQEDLSKSDWKMTQAKLLFEDNKTEEALGVYMELLAAYPSDAFLNYRIAECYYKTVDFAQSLKYLDIAQLNCKEEALSKEIYYLKACNFHKLNDFDKATDNLNPVNKGTALVDSTGVAVLISQVSLAKTAFEHPGNYSVVNAGDSVNSSFNEIFPVCSRAESKLYFTSDRQIKESQEKSLITNNYLYSVFESMAEPDRFSAPVLVDEVFASDRNFILSSVSAGDATFFLYKNSPELKDAGDIYSDTKDTDEDFTDSEKIPGLFNTEFYENTPSFDFINNKLYFVSTRRDKEKKKPDVFMSLYFKDKFVEPEICKISPAYDKAFVYVHPGGDFMVISMNCEKSIGGYDLFISYNDNGKWTEPVNMGYPVNTCSDETQFNLSSDGKTAYISSDRPGGKGGYDIYVVDAGAYFAEKNLSISSLVLFAGQVTDDEGTGVETVIKVSDNSDSKNTQQIKTDSDGYYSFVVKANRKYNLQIKEKIYAEYLEELDLMNVPDGNVEKDFELVKKP